MSGWTPLSCVRKPIPCQTGSYPLRLLEELLDPVRFPGDLSRGDAGAVKGGQAKAAVVRSILKGILDLSGIFPRSKTRPAFIVGAIQEKPLARRPVAELIGSADTEQNEVRRDDLVDDRPHQQPVGAPGGWRRGNVGPRREFRRAP